MSEKTSKFRATSVVTGALLLVAAAIGYAGPSHAGEKGVTAVMTQDLPEYPGKEATMLVVEYPPGGEDPVHRHDAHAFLYVLEGTIVMGLKGGEEVTLHAGQTFHEGPNDIHTVGRNASKTEPAKFVVVLLKDKDKPVLTPLE
ncbi:cupin domain-containing protein [Lysobacter sp. A6]|uniref:Cupin domain-containing protein n=1 Tax=Noviluteimonas lactosilytica TaxID=2888523 RepID=A0ABS8JJL1_9GAMM|nr:cupin domain-containing protein [Lysobacter lactosilyticus]MCC8363742.1 cupin domain-containing protein [Lysobacter lactosilyticus]